METSRLTGERIKQYLKQGKRFDGRDLNEFRDIVIEEGVSNKAEGSVRVKLGKTEVVVGVKLGIAEPYPDSPNKGNLMVTAELLPLSSPRFESGPPRFPAIELGRLVDRGIRESKYIDFEKLCIKEGEKVWGIMIDIYSINDDGNLLDAAFIGALAALKEAKMPFYDEKEEKIYYEKPTKEKLPLTDNMPINFSVHQIEDTIFFDPNTEEEAAAEGRLILAMIPGNPPKICSMQKGNTLQVSHEKFVEMLEFVDKKYKTFYSQINKLIDEAVKKKKE